VATKWISCVLASLIIVAGVTMFAMIQERVRAGLARAKSEGKRLGRPRIAPELEERIRKALATPGRPGVRKIAEQFGVDPGTVQRVSHPVETREHVG
jgi:DNA invertase Pin-like site-specific DNA recombinase